MPISDWPEAERPREKLLQRGADALTDAELLAIFLRTGTKGLTAIDLAYNLLNDFSSLRNLFNAGLDDFCQSKGIGPAKYVQLQAVLEMSKRYLNETLERQDVISSPDQTRHYLKHQLRDRPYEVFAVLFLDNRNQVIKFEELFQGTIDGASVYPREVVKKALAHNAAALIVAHNHPSGVAEPSSADERITLRLKDALGLVDIRLLDHLIIGDGEIISLAERGVI
ncbi:MAG: DNA repair protein RadC [gamma proteobacterium symbiont of Lucinoma myriamae]|nr:DNA repair protein RadC [gamma proteobacterium symbiont of Lucinoma myriamae]MCU7819841.1 DNA repair protein RadC [gamma proteobacterium symbiont of Lucinoma myriamae]MCU7831539.1 DNA repair protein RadC [gamma proteobacterium symbiont of Lucinoma myriamae]